MLSLSGGSKGSREMGKKRYTPEQIIGKLRDKLLNGEIFYTLKEAQILIERWRQEYNTVRPHSALGYRPPAPEAIAVIPRDPGSAMLRQDLWADLTPTLT
jgi:transposase InsO family protein